MLVRDNLYFTHNGTGGAGTLTLAHVTGGADPYLAYGAFAAPTGFSNVHISPYEIVEYTGDITTGFFTPLRVEQGFGTLTIGANIGATTLARTTVQSTYIEGTGYGFGTALNIGNTAANVRILIGPNWASSLQLSPYFDSWNDGGVPPHMQQHGSSTIFGVTNNNDIYIPFDWRVPMRVKKATMRVNTAYTGGTPVSNAYFRLYEFGSNGRPGRLLADFGRLGPTNASLNTVGNISTAVSAAGLLLNPGEYVANFLASFSGGSSSIYMTAWVAGACSSVRFGTSNLNGITYTFSGGGNAVAPDPANVSSYSVGSAAIGAPRFVLAPS